MRYLWRAVNQDGNVRDILVSDKRDAKTAKRFFRKPLKGLEYVPRDCDGQAPLLRHRPPPSTPPGKGDISTGVARPRDTCQELPDTLRVLRRPRQDQESKGDTANTTLADTSSCHCEVRRTVTMIDRSNCS